MRGAIGLGGETCGCADNRGVSGSGRVADAVSSRMVLGAIRACW